MRKITQIKFTELQRQFLAKEKKRTGDPISSIVRRVIQDYMMKRINEQLDKTVEIQVWRGVVIEVKNLPKGWEYLINDKDTDEE